MKPTLAFYMGYSESFNGLNYHSKNVFGSEINAIKLAESLVDFYDITIFVNIPESDEPLVVSINKNKEVFLSENKISNNELSEKLLAIKKANPKVKVFLKADKVVSYDLLMKVMKQIIDSNITNVSLMTNPKE